MPGRSLSLDQARGIIAVALYDPDFPMEDAGNISHIFQIFESSSSLFESVSEELASVQTDMVLDPILHIWPATIIFCFSTTLSNAISSPPQSHILSKAQHHGFKRYIIKRLDSLESG